jgi:hypothetical protein
MPAGRPKKQINLDEAAKLCSLQCTLSEIAGFFGIDEDTVQARIRDAGYDNFSAFYKKHSHGGKISLRRNQFKLSEKSAAMAIWLGKQYLWQSDYPNQEFDEEMDDGFFDALNDTAQEVFDDGDE